jgi:Tfp pilus assembly protein PilW
MGCKITFGKLRTTARAGMTLVEMLMGIGVSTLVLLAVVLFSLYSGKSLAAMWNYVDLDQRSQMALDRITIEARQTTGLLDYRTDRLIFSDADGVALTYEYSPVDKTLTRMKGGSSEVLLSECDDLRFSIYQRNPSNAVYDYFPTASATNCKLINVTWTCSRRILGARMNTESIQTAKVVIRKK